MIANENARLAILKQGEEVTCLSQSTSILGRGLRVSSQDTTDGARQTAPTACAFAAQENTTAVTAIVVAVVSTCLHHTDEEGIN